MLCVLKLSVTYALLLLIAQSDILQQVSARTRRSDCAHVSFNLSIGITQFESGTRTCSDVCKQKITELISTIGVGERQHGVKWEDKFSSPDGQRFVDVCSVTNRLCHGRHWIADTSFPALPDIDHAWESRGCAVPDHVRPLIHCRTAQVGVQNKIISCLCGITLHLYLVHLGWWALPKKLMQSAYQVGKDFFNGTHADCTLSSICHRLSQKYQHLGKWICDDTLNHMVIDQLLSCNTKNEVIQDSWPDHHPENRCVCNVGGQRLGCRELIQTDGSNYNTACEWAVNLPESVIKFAQARETLSTTVVRDMLSLIPNQLPNAVMAATTLGHLPLGDYPYTSENLAASTRASISHSIASHFANIDNLPRRRLPMSHRPMFSKRKGDSAETSQEPLPKRGRHEAQSAAARPSTGMNSAEPGSQNACVSPAREATATTDATAAASSSIPLSPETLRMLEEWLML